MSRLVVFSSYDAWIKYYRPDENSSNSRVGYYTKGALVGFLLDAKIREATQNARSAMRGARRTSEVANCSTPPRQWRPTASTSRAT